MRTQALHLLFINISLMLSFSCVHDTEKNNIPVTAEAETDSVKLWIRYELHGTIKDTSEFISVFINDDVMLNTKKGVWRLCQLGYEESVIRITSTKWGEMIKDTISINEKDSAIGYILDLEHQFPDDLDTWKFISTYNYLDHVSTAYQVSRFEILGKDLFKDYPTIFSDSTKRFIKDTVSVLPQNGHLHVTFFEEEPIMCRTPFRNN